MKCPSWLTLMSTFYNSYSFFVGIWQSFIDSQLLKVTNLCMVHDRNILLTSIMMMIMHYEVLQMKFTIHSKTCTTLHHLIKRNIPFIPNRLGTTSFVLAHPTHIQNTWCAYFFLTWDRIENWFFFVTENRIEKVKKADELTIWLLIYSWTSILSLNNLWFKATCWPWKPTLKTFQNPVILQFVVEALKGHTWHR